MPIYEHGYRAWEGQPTPQATRFLVVARQALSSAIRSKWVWAVLTATIVHVAIRGVILYVNGQVQIPPGGLPPGARDQISFTPSFMADALAFQVRWILMILMALVAAPAISRDLQAGALRFYLSKPLSHLEYLAGKLTAPIALGLSVTALPMLALWVLGVAFTPEALHPEIWRLLGGLLLGSAVATAAASLVVVALSGLLRSTNLAAAAWVALALLTAAGGTLLLQITGEDAATLVDVLGLFDRITEALVGAPASPAPLGGALLVVGALAALAALGLWTVVRDPEVGA